MPDQPEDGRLIRHTAEHGRQGDVHRFSGVHRAHGYGDPVVSRRVADMGLIVLGGVIKSFLRILEFHQSFGVAQIEGEPRPGFRDVALRDFQGIGALHAGVVRDALLGLRFGVQNEKCIRGVRVVGVTRPQNDRGGQRYAKHCQCGRGQRCKNLRKSA